MKPAVALIAIAVLGCKKREEPVARELPVPEAPVAEAKAVPPRPPPPVFPIDKLAAQPADASVDEALHEIGRVVREHTPELGMTTISVSYARKDATLDPTYGALEVALSLSDAPDGIVDDPNRPTGAPVPELMPVESGRTNCPIIRLHKGRWSVEGIGCPEKRFLARLCSVADVWKQAIVEGAPENAVATMQRDVGLDFWTFQIQDKVRKVDFTRYIHEDKCPPAPASGSAAPRPNPD